MWLTITPRLEAVVHVHKSAPGILRLDIVGYPSYPVQLLMPFLVLSNVWEAVQAYFQGQTAPPHFGIFCGCENRKNRCIVQQRPSYLHVTLSRRQVTVPIAVILLAASIRCIVEVTRPRELAYLKERKVLRCYCAVDPDEKPRNNWQWSF